MLCIDSDEDDDGNAASGNQIMHQTSQESPASPKPRPEPPVVPKPATAPPEHPKAKTATKKPSNVYSNAKNAIETATDFSSLEAMEKLLEMRLNQEAITEEQKDVLEDLIGLQRETLATAAIRSSMFPAGLPKEQPDV